MGKEMRMAIDYDKDTQNYYKYALPPTKILFSKNFVYFPKDEDVPKTLTMSLGTMADTKKVVKLRKAK